jgi:hypothetical protein
MFGKGMQEGSICNKSPHESLCHSASDHHSTEEQSAFSRHQIAQDRTVVKEYDRLFSGHFPFIHTGYVEGLHSTDNHQHI